MPSIASHFVCAKLSAKELDITNLDDYYRGSILPDIIDLNNSHYKIRGSYYLIPNINEYLKNHSLENDVNVGYLNHLLLDRYFLEEFIPLNIPSYNKENIFVPSLIYTDYTNLNYRLVKYYGLNLDYINEFMQHFEEKTDEQKYEKNLSCINNKEYGELLLIDFPKYVAFLDEVAIKIRKDIKRYRGR